MKEKKVVLLGLDNAGKSSFIKVLDLDYKNIQQLSPTVRIERSEIKVLDFSITRWDCGGQEKFRKEYIVEESKVLVDVDYVIYFIDVTDPDRYDEALDYLIDILEAYKLIGEVPPFMVCIHKVDPTFIELPGMKKSVPRWDLKENISELVSRIKNLLSGLDVPIFLTSIYDRNSILMAFSYVLKSFLTESERSKLVEAVLSEFVREYDLVGGSVVERSSMLFADYILDNSIKDLFSAVVTNGIILYENIQVVKPIFKMVINVENYGITFIKFIKERREFIFALIARLGQEMNKAILDLEENYFERIYSILS
ncbi:MAG: ADP-ribosylation factor-like protein [Candidatus Helarchaeota archaeon]